MVDTMIIGVCGFTSTGSSAVTDILKEFNENSVLDDHEFTLAYFPDGLNDLSYHLQENISKYMSSNVAIERYKMLIKNLYKNNINKETNGKLFQLTEEYIDSITQICWKGYGAVDYILYTNKFKHVLMDLFRKVFIRTINKYYKKNINIYPVRTMSFSIKPDDFERITKQYINDILEAMGADFNKNIVLNQPFPGNDPESSFSFFDNPLAIVVDRDPRDNYIFAKKFLLNKGRQIPTETVEKFVVYYRNMRKGMPYIIGSDKILNIRFEDLIYEYDESITKIMTFCGLKEHTNPRTIFAPELSINNTQVFKRYPEYRKEIEYIERELPEFLYPFEKYPEIEVTGNMFSGRSPLNK